MNKASDRLLALSVPAVAGLLSLTALPALASSQCEGLKGCERKFCEITQELRVAESEGNASRAEGLASALAEARLHCTDEGLREDLVEEIDEAREDLEEYEADLAEAAADGDIEDIRKYQARIADKKGEIGRLEDELSGLD